MITTGQILIPSVTANSFSPSYPNYSNVTKYNWVGDPVKAAGYYNTPSGLQTIAYYVTNFNGSLVFEGTLDSEPNTSPNAVGTWFTVAQVSGFGANTYYTNLPDPTSYIVSSEVFVGDGIRTTFLLQSVLTNDTVIVSIDGVIQIPSTINTGFSLNSSYYVSGASLVFAHAPLTGYLIEVREFFAPISTQPITSQLFTASGNVNSFLLNTSPVSYSTNGVLVSVNGILQIPIGNSSNIANVEVGSYQVISANVANTQSNTASYTNTLQFNWTPLAGDKIEVREIVTSNVQSQVSFSGAGVLNVEGNFTWLRCRVLNWQTVSNGNVGNTAINKITLSY